MTKPTLCKVDGCGKPARHIGLCVAHYKRQYKYGDPLAGAPAHYSTPEEAFAARTVAMPSGCIHWTGANDDKGYGQLRIKRKLIKAHRYAYMRVHGAIPTGNVILHECDNPACVNVDHLRLGTQLENVRDMDAKRRRINNQPKGEFHVNAKVTPEIVMAIRSDHRRQVDIAAHYGISQSVVSKIKLQQAWRHVT